MTPPPRDHRPEDASWTLPSLLREAADLLETDPADCPDEVKRERVLVLCAVSGRFDAALAREVGVFDANTVWAGDGNRTAASWITSRSELSSAHAGAVARTACDVRACPAVASAWADGRIGTAKVTALVKARAVHPELFAECETALVDEVAPMTVKKRRSPHRPVGGHRRSQPRRPGSRRRRRRPRVGAGR